MGCTSSKKTDIEIKVLYDGDMHYVKLPATSTIGSILDAIKRGHRQKWLEVSFRGRDIEDRDTTLAMNDIRDTNDIYVKFDMEKFVKHLDGIMDKELQNNKWTVHKHDATLGEVLVKYGLYDELCIALEDKLVDMTDELAKAIEKRENPVLLPLIKRFK